jgi:3D (Asp-Asp-Asp) domain-containing protein
VKKGVIGVTRDWYRLFAMDQIYVPGYGIGTVADVGGGIPGSYWIDLGYSDADWVPWYGSVTIYFLTPVPANVPAVLP